MSVLKCGACARIGSNDVTPMAHSPNCEKSVLTTLNSIEAAISTGRPELVEVLIFELNERELTKAEQIAVLRVVQRLIKAKTDLDYRITDLQTVIENSLENIRGAVDAIEKELK